MSFGPEQHTLPVREHCKMTGIPGELADKVKEMRHNRPQRMTFQPLPRPARIKHARRRPVRFDARIDAPRPRPHDYFPKYRWRSPSR
jgi:hypothetical protein